MTKEAKLAAEVTALTEMVRVLSDKVAEMEAQPELELEPVACQYAKDVLMPEYRCVKRCQYDTSPPAQRKPLTDAQINVVWDGLIESADYSRAMIVRAIEAAHGIKE